MYLYKCDICGHLQEEGEKFYGLCEITTGDRGINIDFCEKCYKRFQDLENKEKKHE